MILSPMLFKNTRADLHAICQPKFEYKIINMSLEPRVENDYFW